MDKVQFDQKNVWKIVKKIRKSFLSQLKDPKCQVLLLSDSDIKDNIDVVEEKLNLNIEIDPNENVSDETLQFTADLFTYLNYCPPEHFHVLSSIIKSESAKNILLALTSMMKTSKTKTGKQSSTKIFTKAMEIFSLFIYRDIDDAITKEKGFDDQRNNLEHYHETLKVLGDSELLEFLESL